MIKVSDINTCTSAACLQYGVRGNHISDMAPALKSIVDIAVGSASSR
jgi:hypothetical protein